MHCPNTGVECAALEVIEVVNRELPSAVEIDTDEAVNLCAENTRRDVFGIASACGVLNAGLKKLVLVEEIQNA